MWSAALDVLLTTLRYLAPATLLTLFWGQQSFLFKILKHIDSAFRAIVFSSEEQKQEVLKWLAEAGSVRVEHLDTVWRHGWIVCGVLDSVLPGACAGHPPTRLSLKHAQAIADHYLGVEPVFSRSELDSNDSLSRHQEWKLATYLARIREALSKITPPVSKPSSQRTSPDTSQITLDYAAKGPGLMAAQVNNKMFFKIYPTAQQSLDPGEITILIKGPKDTYGMTVLPPVFGKAQLIRQKLLGLQSKASFTENVLPTTQGAAYLRSYGKNDMSKTYYIPKTKYDIAIEAEFRPDHVKVIYFVPLEGRYEVSITSRGQGIVGSPFTVKASNNILEVLQKDSFCLDDGEEIDIVDVKTDRKVVLRIVDFVTEKMLLRENGTLEQISEDEAKALMATDSGNDKTISAADSNIYDCSECKTKKFSTIAQKILKMNRVCRTLNSLMDEKQFGLQKTDNPFLSARNQPGIPDIVNSTFTDNHVNQYILPEKRDKYIIPQNITVSLTTEKAKSSHILEPCDPINELGNPALPHATEIITDDQIEDSVSSDIMTTSSNPFLSDIIPEENYDVDEKSLGTFVATEYETNNSKSEETQNSSVQIVIENTDTTLSPLQNNPFFDDIISLERPKSPIYKIAAGEKINREGPVYFDQQVEFCDEALGNEFINPFFMHQHNINDETQVHQDIKQPRQHEKSAVTDFIIGAPVSLPPLIRSSSPLPDLKCEINRQENLDTTSSHDNAKCFDHVDNIPLARFSETSPENIGEETDNSNSLESNLTMDTSNASTTSDNQYEPYKIGTSGINRNISPRKDTWDSAYVSIDDNNSSPDNNNNDSSIVSETQNKILITDDIYKSKQEELLNMGPAERELWQNCSDLKNDNHSIQDEIRLNRWEIKRPMFTPIIEENDRSVSSAMKDISKVEPSDKHNETDTVTVAFAELNDLYQEYFPPSETSVIISNEDDKLHQLEQDNIMQTNTKDENVNVDSASDVLSDVKRQKERIEGTISEVQANVTESVSASQILHNNVSDQIITDVKHSADETQFGDSSQSNIVLERKKYWDEKIRLIEAKTEESTKHQRRRRVSSKQLKHNDSLSKRKGKQVIKNFLNAGESHVKQAKAVSHGKQTDNEANYHAVSPAFMEPEKPDANLVEKWKKYWDDKLQAECVEVEAVNPKLKAQQNQDSYLKQNIMDNDENKVIDVVNEDYEAVNNVSSHPVKQELSEEVFKAFETSPKRFFGTSRKHILSKIDTFLRKPSAEEIVCKNVVEASQDSGLVSSRISLFHKISNTEELALARRTSQCITNKDDELKTIVKNNEHNIKTIPKATTGTPRSPQAENFSNNSNKISTENINNIECDSTKNITLTEKRARMVKKIHGESFDVGTVDALQKPPIAEKPQIYIKRVTSDFHKPSHIDRYKKDNILRKSSISKSDMDIFNKSNEASNDNLNKYVSCDELPKINVKNFISLYENVSKTTEDSSPVKQMYRTSSIDSHKSSQNISIKADATSKMDKYPYRIPIQKSSSVSDTLHDPILSKKRWLNKSLETVSFDSMDSNKTESFEILTELNNDGESTYTSLSDIEIEIIESMPEKYNEPPPEKPVEAHIEYKSRFKMAKQFFQSLEELREEKKPRKLNECELLLRKNSTESLENERPQKRVKKNIKSHSMPSSEISKVWNQMQNEQNENNEGNATKLVKISEKFNVDDLFNDVMEGRLSRQGSLRGIPHKNAVLEAFRSMENVTDTKLSPYEFATTQLSDFAQENKIKNAQTYLSEYPYLPTTDPSKYHSRLDTKASGLISFKELLERKPRRNSVPDLRLNLKFTADL